MPWPLSQNPLCLALSSVRAWVVGWMLEECLPYRVTHCPTAFAPRLARSEGVLLAGAVSRVTKAPFYTTGVQRMVHSTVVLLGSAPARRSWISRPPPVLPANTLIGGDVLSPKPGRDIRGTWGSWCCLQETAREDK